MEQLIETSWSYKNKTLYISKGYVFTKISDKLYVHAKDLPINSHAQIKYICDICGKQFDTCYQAFNRSNNCLCQHCAKKTVGAKKRKKPFSDVKSTFEAMGYILKSPESDYKNNKSKLICTCTKHGDFTTTYQYIHNGNGCYKCWLDNYKGSGNPNWKGGITEIYNYFRLQLSPWIQQQLQRTNYKCELTGKTGTLNVHHMNSFNSILSDTIKELNMDIRPNISDYSEDELQLIVVNFLKNNELKAKPVVMLESVHQDFHSFCGGTSKDTSFEQLEEFKQQLNKSVAC